MVRLITIFFLILLTTNANALTTISNSDTFPMSLVGGETYQLSENISCDDTCFVISGTSGVLDLNDFTMTFGAGFSADIVNKTFNDWTGSVPDNWTVVSGSLTEASPINGSIGTSDISASASFIIRSDAITLTADKSYLGHVYARGNDADSMTVSIVAASDNTVLATWVNTGAKFGDGYASSGDFQADCKYKPTSDISVKLQLEFSGTNAVVVTYADIKPVNQFGVVSNNYASTAYLDIVGQTWGYVTSWTVKDGTIQQGTANGVGAIAVTTSESTDLIVDNLDINLTGQNTHGIAVSGGSGHEITDNVIDDNCPYPYIFNRQHGAAGIALYKGRTGHSIVSRNIVRDYPQYGIMLLNGLATQELTDAHTALVSYNELYGRAIVTEPYGINVNASSNVEIAYNTITPIDGGRGILSDTTVNSGIEESSGEIHHNTITNIYEEPNFEYPNPLSLQAAAIRIRNFGGGAEVSIWDIYDNTIQAYTDINGAEAGAGINVTAHTDDDSVIAYNNTITTSATGTAKKGTGILLNGAGYYTSATLGTFIFRNNNITSTHSAVQFSGSDVAYAGAIKLYSNKLISTGGDTIWFYEGGTLDTAAIYCNQITYSGGASDEFPFRFSSGTIDGVTIDYNEITNNNSGGYEVWVDINRSADVLAYGNGTLDVTGGGSIGAAGSATNGSAGCYSSAGIIASHPLYVDPSGKILQ